MVSAIWRRFRLYQAQMKAERADLSHYETNELARLMALAELPGGQTLTEPLSAFDREKSK